MHFSGSLFLCLSFFFFLFIHSAVFIGEHIESEECLTVFPASNVSIVANRKTKQNIFFKKFLKKLKH